MAGARSDRFTTTRDVAIATPSRWSHFWEVSPSADTPGTCRNKIAGETFRASFLCLSLKIA